MLYNSLLYYNQQIIFYYIRHFNQTSKIDITLDNARKLAISFIEYISLLIKFRRKYQRKSNQRRVNLLVIYYISLLFDTIYYNLRYSSIARRRDNIRYIIKNLLNTRDSIATTLPRHFLPILKVFITIFFLQKIFRQTISDIISLKF